MSTLVTVRQTTTTTTTTTAMSATNDGQTSIRSYGITQPISMKGPDPSDRIATDSLEETLRSYDYFESDAELSHRGEVMAKLDTLVKKWIRDVSITKNIPSETAETVGGRVHTFGSYRLGVHSKGGDIDTLLIAPRHIDRIDFFTSFVECLRQQPEVCDLHAVEEAFVPVIKLIFDGIELDMLFARLALPTIPNAFDLKDDRILVNLDERCVRSLNGCRVADEILDLVPNRETFKSTLRAIKLWAKKNGLYSNVLGFFGGITWALLVARICQLYPNAVAATLVHKFFVVYSKWEWPTPVLIKPVNDSQYGFTVWDSKKNPFDRHHLMPVITPAYPQQNSTHNVSMSTQKIIVQEIKRGLEIVNEIISSKAEWKKLFTGIPFVQRYKHYIVLLLSAPDQIQYVEWSGLVEAKIRLLIRNLERNPYIELAHVNSEKYTPNESVFEQLVLTDGASIENDHSNKSNQKKPSEPNGHRSPESSSANGAQPSITSPSTSSTFRGMWIVGLQFRKASNVQVDLTKEIDTFVNDVVYQTAASSNKNCENIKLAARYKKRQVLQDILTKHPTTPRSTHSPLPRKADLAEDRSDANANLPLKRPKLDSISSEAGSNPDSDLESPIKRLKAETTDGRNAQPSPQTSESNLTTD